MNPYTLAGAFLAAVAVGMCIPSWVARRRAARRRAKAEAAFWSSLQRLVDTALADFDTPPLDDDLALAELRAEMDVWNAKAIAEQAWKDGGRS